MDAVISGIVHMDNIAAENSIIQPDNAKTRQATRYGVRLFREYCVQHGVDTINNLPPREIAAMLKGFYGQARTKDGQRFSVNSLIAIRYAISRYYRSPMVHRKIDIVKDSAFNDANETFRAVLKDLERESRGTACQKELQMVDMDDRRKLRHYFEHAISTPRGLLQKVWYDLMLRVGRRGRESQRLLNRNSFRIAKTADGRQYIYQVNISLCLQTSPPQLVGMGRVKKFAKSVYTHFSVLDCSFTVSEINYCLCVAEQRVHFLSVMQ